MDSITDRQKLILTIVIHEHVRTAKPVGSRHMVEQFRLDMSPATVRNELAALTDLGYLKQPHPSAGRVPSEIGYRLFVSNLLQDTVLPEDTRRTITHQFYQMRDDVEQWMRLAASVLAYQSQAASLVTALHQESARFKHLELISTRGRQVLMVLVVLGGEVHQRLIALPEPVPQDQLSRMANHITHFCEGLDGGEIRARKTDFSPLELDLALMVADEMQQSDALLSGEVYLDGFSNVLAEPEFSESGDARRALRILEEKPLLQNLLSQTVLRGNTIGGVHVLIGGEGTLEEMRQCSLVLANYGTPGVASGTLGVLGPMRMSYGRTISVVRFLSGLLSDMVNESLTDERDLA